MRPDKRRRRPGEEAPHGQEHVGDELAAGQDCRPQEGEGQAPRLADDPPGPAPEFGRDEAPENRERPAITTCRGIRRVKGIRVFLDGDPVPSLASAITAHDGEEAWWSPHTWADDKRKGASWQAACSVVLDLDCAGHGVLSEELGAAALESLRDVPNLLHLTPHGLRVAFVLDEPVSDPALFARAAHGAAAMVKDALRSAGVTGLEIDSGPTTDRARVFFAPNARVACKRKHSECSDPQRRAEVLVRRTDLYSVRELASYLSAKPEPEHDGPKLTLFVSDGERIERAIRDGGAFDEGDEIRFRCPRPGHEDEHPSARYNPTKLLWYCDVCRKGGGLRDLSRLLGIPLNKADSRTRPTSEAGRGEPEGAAPDRAGGSDADRPEIFVEGGLLPEIVNEAEAALLAHPGDQIYQRGTTLVRAVRAPAFTIGDIYRRAVGVLMLCDVDPSYLVERLTRAAKWLRPTKKDIVEIDCPAKVARTYLVRVGEWRVDRLLGVIEAPTLRPDGSILQEPGYDQQTCLLFDPGGTEFPPIPEFPTREEALAALCVVLELLKDFPWLEPCDRSAAVAAILTALVRHSLRTAPMTGFRAPKMASGKSLLADVVALIATGRVASVMTQGKDEEEDRKRLLAILMEGISVACIDNIERPFGSAALCSILTQESWRDRVLGKTGTATVPTTTTWLVTGNNIQFVGDITTRLVVSDLDPKCERPEEREFDVNLHQYIPAHRGEIVAAALTILRAYHVAGRPKQGLPTFGRFEDWSNWIRSALVWLGQADPCGGRHRLEDTDPVRRQLRNLLTAWHREIADTIVTAAEAIAIAQQGGKDEPDSLYQAFFDVAAKDGRPDGRRLGNYLSRYEKRAEAGLRVERVGDRQGLVRWRVVRLEEGGGGADSDGQSSPGVGFVGFVGSFQPEKNANAAASSSSPPPTAPRDTSDTRGSDSRPAGTDPRNPRNPPDHDEPHRPGAPPSDDELRELGWA